MELTEGVIVAQRHIHLSTAQAEEAGVKNGDIVKVKFDGPRALVFDNVVVRAGDTHERDMHLDTDEANAAGLQNGQLGEIVK